MNINNTNKYFSFAPKNNQIYFNGKPKNIEMPNITVLNDIGRDYVTSIKESINRYPQKFLSEIAENGIDILISHNLEDAYKYKGISDPLIEQAEKSNNSGILSATYYKRVPQKGFIVFTDKPRSEEFVKQLVNHELSQCMVFIRNLKDNTQVLDVLNTDIKGIEKKLTKLPQNEQKLVKDHLLNENAHMPLDKIISDTLAWQQEGGGLYGSGLIEEIYNPKLLPSLFPNLSNYLKHKFK